MRWILVATAPGESRFIDYMLETLFGTLGADQDSLSIRDRRSMLRHSWRSRRTAVLLSVIAGFFLTMPLAAATPAYPDTRRQATVEVLFGV